MSVHWSCSNTPVRMKDLSAPIVRVQHAVSRSSSDSSLPCARIRICSIHSRERACGQSVGRRRRTGRAVSGNRTPSITKSIWYCGVRVMFPTMMCRPSWSSCCPAHSGGVSRVQVRITQLHVTVREIEWILELDDIIHIPTVAVLVHVHRLRWAMPEITPLFGMEQQDQRRFTPVNAMGVEKEREHVAMQRREARHRTAGNTGCGHPIPGPSARTRVEVENIGPRRSRNIRRCATTSRDASVARRGNEVLSCFNRIGRFMRSPVALVFRKRMLPNCGRRGRAGHFKCRSSSSISLPTVVLASSREPSSTQRGFPSGRFFPQVDVAQSRVDVELAIKCETGSPLRMFTGVIEASRRGKLTTDRIEYRRVSPAAPRQVLSAEPADAMVRVSAYVQQIWKEQFTARPIQCRQRRVAIEELHTLNQFVVVERDLQNDVGGRQCPRLGSPPRARTATGLSSSIHWTHRSSGRSSTMYTWTVPQVTTQRTLSARGVGTDPARYDRQWR